jgi:hypothetical protein
MPRRLLFFLTSLLIAWGLAACGGGSGGSSPPPDTAPVASAGGAQTVATGAIVVLDGRGSSDADNDPLTFAWVLMTRPAGSQAALSGADTAQPTFTADVPGSYVASLTVNDGTLSSQAATVTITAVPIDTLTIVTDKAEPLSGVVTLSLSGSTAGAPVLWFVDLVQLDTHGNDQQVSWDTTTATNAPHQILARVVVSPDKNVDIQRTVNVANSDIHVSASVSGTSGTIAVDVSASAPSGIASVSADFDGAPVGTLTAPNACTDACPPYDLYRFTVDAASAGSGNHVMLVTVVDGAGETQQVSVPVPIANPPVIVVTSPVDGAFAYGTLQVSGSVSSDQPGPVSVTATLGQVQVLQTTGPTFDTSYDLTGLPAGTYVLTIVATDSVGTPQTVTRQVNVTSSAALVYTPILSLGVHGNVLAVDGDLLLYQADDLSVRIRDTAAGTETVLQDTATLGTPRWAFDGGLAYASATDSACPPGCIFQWLADGTRHDLSANDPGAANGVPAQLVAQDGQVLWADTSYPLPSTLTVYDATTGAYTLITPPAGVNYLSTGDAVAVAGGQVYAFYVAETGMSGSTFLFDVYQWTSGTGASTPVSTPGHVSLAPQTDGVRVAWTDGVPNPPPDTMPSLVSEPIGGSTLTALSTSVGSFTLRDGVLAFSELFTTTQDLKASTSSATSTLSIAQGPVLFDTGGGFVAYTEYGKTYSWNSANAQATLRIDVTPTELLVSQGRMYFVMGDSKTLYKVPLQ